MVDLMANLNFSTGYWYYELYSLLESVATPFCYMVNYMNEHPGTRCFIFAKNCKKDDIDAWLNDERVKVYWWEDMTKTHANNPEDFDGLSDFIEALNELIEPDFGAIIEILLPIASEELFSLYYLADNHPAGKVVITNSDGLDVQIIQQFQATFGNQVDRENVRPFLKSLYGGWALFGYGASGEMRLGSDFRWDYITIPSYSDIDISSIDWGTLQGSNHTTF